MTTKEQVEALLAARQAFYNWKPGDTPYMEQRFRCHHQSSRPIMHGLLCKARANKLEIFQSECSGCPRWKYYRKQIKTKPVRIPYL